MIGYCGSFERHLPI